MIEEDATSQEHVVAYMQATNISSKAQLIESVLYAVCERTSFAVAGLSRLEQIGILLNKKWKDYKAIETAATKFTDGQTSTTITLSSTILSTIGRLSLEDARAMKNALGDSRIIILVDDLDRINPKLLPDILLLIRDGLSIPGFSFVLAFDDNMIAKTVADYHSAWGDGYEFIDKIIDAAFVVPPMLKIEARRIFLDYVEDDDQRKQLDKPEIISLLPQNPRKIKLISRRMVVVLTTLTSADDDEYDLFLIMLCEALRAESPKLLRTVLDSSVDILGEVIGYTDEHAQKWSDDLIATTNLKPSPHKSNLLRQVFNRTRIGRCDYHVLRRHALASEEETIVTRREARHFFANPEFFSDSKHLVDWIEVIRDRTRVTRAMVVEQLIVQLILERQDVLERASRSISGLRQSTAINDALKLLTCVNQLRLSSVLPMIREEFNTELLMMIYRQHSEWAKFTRNPGEKDLRDSEIRELLDIVSTSRLLPMSTLSSIKPWKERSSISREKIDVSMKIGSRLVDRLWSTFTNQEGLLIVRTFEVSEERDAIEYIMFESSGNILTRMAEYVRLQGDGCLSEHVDLCIEILRNLWLFIGHRSVTWDEICKGSEKEVSHMLSVVWDVSVSNRWNFRYWSWLEECANTLKSFSKGMVSVKVPEWEREQMALRSE